MFSSKKKGIPTSILGSFSLATRDTNEGEPGIEAWSLVVDARVLLFRDVSSTLFVMSRSKNCLISISYLAELFQVIISRSPKNIFQRILYALMNIY